MSAFYEELAAVATDMIREFGTSFVLRSFDHEEEYDPITGEVTPPGEPIDSPFTGVRMSITEEYAASVGQGAIQSRDILIMADPAMRTPALEDTIVIADEVWQIVNIHKEQPADTVLFYMLQARP